MKRSRLDATRRISNTSSGGALRPSDTAGRNILARAALVAICISIAVPSSGCVRRKVTVNTEPSGAVIWLNDEEIGRSPATVDFLWYGDYDVVARLKGYETLRTHHRLVEPWYQAPGIDFIAEVLYPGWIVDSREMHFELSPESLPTRDALLENARLTREMALADPNQSSATDVASEPDVESVPDENTDAAPAAKSETATGAESRSTHDSNIMTEVK